MPDFFYVKPGTYSVFEVSLLTKSEMHRNDEISYPLLYQG